MKGRSKGPISHACPSGLENFIQNFKIKTPQKFPTFIIELIQTVKKIPAASCIFSFIKTTVNDFF